MPDEPLIAGVNEPSLELYKLMAQTVRDYAIFFLDPQGRVASWNPGARAIKQYEAHEIVGQHFSKFYQESDVAKGWPQHELKVAAETGVFEDEGWRVRKDGTRFWANVLITALKDNRGKVLAFTKITRDLTERKQHEELVRQSEERFRLLVEGVEEYAIYMLDPKGIVTSWNTGARRITGYESAEIVGRHFATFYTQEDAENGRPAAELMTARAQGRAEDEGWRVRKNGSRFWARVAVTPLYDSTGTLRGFAKVTQDLTQRKQAEAIESASHNINEFIAVLAHELRNPLAPIRSAVHLMKLDKLPDSERQGIVQVLDRQSSQLMRIVDDILDVSRITRGKFSIQKEVVPVFQIITRAIEAARPELNARHHTLNLDMTNAPESIIGDEQRLAQALTNVLNNAVRYTDPGGQITLRISAQYSPKVSELVISVRDNGRGIDPAYLGSIFGMFVQEDGGQRDVSGKGLGVGLALAKSIVELHEGTLEVASEGKGKGSEFTLRIPLAQRYSGPELAPANVDSSLDNLSILVIDDNVDAASLLAAFLRSLKHQVREAHSGPEALELFRQQTPQLVLLDIGMPNMDGHEVARQIRALPGGDKTYIVAVTGWGKAEDRERSRSAGIDMHLVKPVEAKQLVELLATGLTRSAQPGNGHNGKNGNGHS
jgi:PAS domain S-box-containing protein